MKYFPSTVCKKMLPSTLLWSSVFSMAVSLLLLLMTIVVVGIAADKDSQNGVISVYLLSGKILPRDDVIENIANLLDNKFYDISKNLDELGDLTIDPKTILAMRIYDISRLFKDMNEERKNLVCLLIIDMLNGMMKRGVNWFENLSERIIHLRHFELIDIKMKSYRNSNWLEVKKLHKLFNNEHVKDITLLPVNIREYIQEITVAQWISLECVVKYLINYLKYSIINNEQNMKRFMKNITTTYSSIVCNESNNNECNNLNDYQRYNCIRTHLQMHGQWNGENAIGPLIEFSKYVHYTEIDKLLRIQLHMSYKDLWRSTTFSNKTVKRTTFLYDSYEKYINNGVLDFGSFIIKNELVIDFIMQ